jgi:hypothetical protein
LESDLDLVENSVDSPKVLCVGLTLLLLLQKAIIYCGCPLNVDAQNREASKAQGAKKRKIDFWRDALNAQYANNPNLIEYQLTELEPSVKFANCIDQRYGPPRQIIAFSPQGA